MAITRRRRRKQYSGPARVIAYTRVSTSEQSDSGAGLAAQRTAITAHAERQGWQSVEYVTDAGISAKTVEDRPALVEALSRLAAGDADVLVVSKLDRLSRSVHDFSGILQAATREGWSLVILDLALDMTTPQGSMMAGVLSVFAEFERRLISDRTKAGMAAKKAAGVRIGRPRDLPDNLRERIASMRNGGMTYARIADMLNSEGVATARNASRWHSMTVYQIVKAA